MLHEFVYLFLTDLVRTTWHDYKSYTENEPGYGCSMLRAYITAFNKQTDGLMSEELIHAIHKEAMAFAPNSNPGQYKNDHNHLTVYPYEIGNFSNPSYNAYSEGVNEFIEYWFKNTDNPFHSVCNVNNDDSKGDLYHFIPKFKGVILSSSDSKGNLNNPRMIDFDDTSKKINELMSLSKNKCEINHFIEEPQEKVQKLTSQRMKVIINAFNGEIINAQTSDDKIKCIAKYTQRIDQLHPYSDGNIRTCYILMNKLLNDHGLSLTLLMNPNRLDACSLEQVVHMIKQGQIHYQQVIKHHAGNIQLSAEKELHEAVQSFTCFPQKLHDISQLLVEDFIACVIEGKLKRVNTLKNNPYSFLSAAKPTDKLIEELSVLIDFKDKKNNPLLTALEKKQYNLALRQICANYKVNVIETFLTYQNRLSLNPLEQSSSGKTAMDWLDVNKHLEPNTQELMKNILLSFIKQADLEDIILDEDPKADFHKLSI